ncbi:hypothetical protein [Sinomonas sp. G460-2]
MKDHELYNDVKQTVLSRPKMVTSSAAGASAAKPEPAAEPRKAPRALAA